MEVSSFLAFGLAALLILLKRPRITPVLLVVVWGVAFAVSPFLSCFVVGVALAWIYSEGLFARLASYFRTAPIVAYLTAACITMLIPFLWGHYLPVGFYTVVGRTTPFSPLATMVIIQSVAAALMLFSALLYARFGRLLATRAGKMLGRLSFPIYLVHLPIICSFSSWLYLRILPTFDRPVDVAIVSLTTVLVITAVSMPLAALDARWTALLRRWVSALLRERMSLPNPVSLKRLQRR